MTQDRVGIEVFRLTRALWPVLALGGCLGAEPQVGVAAAPIIGGASDPGDPGVVLVLLESGLSTSLCTGEVISPHVVLTAAHCTDPAVIGKGKYRVFLGSDLSRATAADFVAVKETHFHPDWSIDTVQDGHDIAVVVTQTALPVTPIALNRTPLEQAMVGQPVRFVGFGVTAGTDKDGTSAGVKRQVSSKLSGFDALLVNFNDTQHLTCTGDSGGPAFMTLDGQHEVIVGVTSYGDTSCAHFGVDTRVDAYVDSFVQPLVDSFDPPPAEPEPAAPTSIRGGCAFAGAGADGLVSLFALCALAWGLRRGLRR